MNDNNPTQSSPLSSIPPATGASNPPPPPLSTTPQRPFFISEEDHAAPPPPPAAAPTGNLPSATNSSSGLIGHLAPSSPEKPQQVTPVQASPRLNIFTKEENVATNPVVPPPPPVSSPKKKGKGKIIAGIVAVLVLLAAIPAGILLINQNTELREKANTLPEEDLRTVGGPGSCPYTPHTDVVRVLTDVNNCKVNVHVREDCSEYNGAAYDCPSTAQCEKDRVVKITTDSKGCKRNIHTREDCTEYEGGPYECPVSSGGGDQTDAGDETSRGGVSGCTGIDRAGPLVHAEAVNINLGNQSYANCSVVADFVDKYQANAGRAWAVERICRPNVAAASDGQNLITQSGDVVQQYLGQYGANACQEWVNAHGTEIGGQCVNANTVVVYKYPYNAGDKISAPYGNKLRAGDAVKLCLTGGGRPQFSINDGEWRVAQLTGVGTEKCLQYDIPGGASTLKISAQR